MGRETVYANQGTWYQEGDSVNHSSDAWLKCTGTETAEYAFRSILQFALPNALRYKKITKVLLNYYTKVIWNGEERTGIYDTGMQMAPYVVSNSAISQVTGASLDSFGQIGDYIRVEAKTWQGQSYPCWRSGDVTSIFRSNLYDDTYFTVIFKGYPGYTNTAYGVIGSATASSYIPYLVIDYEDVPQLAPTPNYPVGAYINENTDIVFNWSWNSSTGATQASVQLEYKLASAGSWTVVSLTQTAHTYTLSGGLAQGAYQWRIKGTNDAGETSDYSSTAEFTVIGQPAAPVISTPANKALTTIEWTAADQNSYDITLTDSNSVVLIDETVASSVSSYKPQMLLQGTYTVGIRYRNSTGLSSAWTYKTFTINASGPSKPTAVLYGEGESARIVVTVAANTNYALMRAEDNGENNFQIVGKFTSNKYIDSTLKFNTPYIYKVRAYASAGYTDSDPMRYLADSERISLEANGVTLVLERSEEEFLPYTEDSKREMAVYRCPGRRYPVVEHSEVDSWIFQSALFVTEADKQVLKDMAIEDYIFYRDYSGRAFPVAIQTLSFQRFMKEGYTANIEFVRIAEKEVVINV